jgi:hypothetical protein
MSPRQRRIVKSIPPQAREHKIEVAGGGLAFGGMRRGRRGRSSSRAGQDEAGALWNDIFGAAGRYARAPHKRSPY